MKFLRTFFVALVLVSLMLGSQGCAIVKIPGRVFRGVGQILP